jgi:hypothetical protein
MVHGLRNLKMVGDYFKQANYMSFFSISLCLKSLAE